MANDLTGGFDVVAQFALRGANRVLAAMHRGQRFPHSLSMRVDDSPDLSSGGSHSQDHRVARAVVDQVGNAVTDPVLLAQAPSVLKNISASNPIFNILDPIANPGKVGPIYTVGPLSHLRGIAQLQLSVPTMTIADESGNRVTIHLQIMARYFAEPDTHALPEFLRGEIQISVSIDEIAAQAGNVVDINLRDSKMTVIFNPAWSDQALDASDVTRIEQVLRNSLRTSFLPSNAVLPNSIQQMQFKGLLGDPQVVCVLLNMTDVSGDPANVQTVYLDDTDDFAFAAGSDFVEGQFSASINGTLDQNNLRQFAPPSIQTSVYGNGPLGFRVKLGTITTSATASIKRATVALQEGQILLTIPGSAYIHFDVSGLLSLVDYPDTSFDFQVLQHVTLQVTDDQDTVQLGFAGDASVTILTSGVDSRVASVFTDAAQKAWKQMRDQALGSAQTAVGPMFSANANLGKFLNSLTGAQSQDQVSAHLAYSSIEIHADGIILHGSLAVPDWPSAHAEFDLNPWTAGSGAHEYSALNSWIPGGTIREYIWTLEGKPQPLRIESNTFVYSDAPSSRTQIISPFAGSAASGTGRPDTGFGPRSHPFVAPAAGFIPICVTVEGVRIPASGPNPQEAVHATVCGWTSHALGMINAFKLTQSKKPPDVALTRVAPSGALEMMGQTSPWVSGSGNLIVHFPDETSAAHLDFLTQALRESGRTDTATSLLAVLAPDQWATIKPTEGVIFAEDVNGDWEGALEVKRRSATLVIGRSGDVVWRHDGELSSAHLAGALKTHLVAGGRFSPRLVQASVRIGQLPPNFLFEYAPGRELILRKLIGRPVVLVFWKSSSKASLEALQYLQEIFGQDATQGPVVLAINDGEAPEAAKEVAAENRLSAILVTDPDREISLAYGVSIWPTTISVDARGLVGEIHFGRFSGREAEYPARAKTGAAE